MYGVHSNEYMYNFIVFIHLLTRITLNLLFDIFQILKWVNITSAYDIKFALVIPARSEGLEDEPKSTLIDFGRSRSKNEKEEIKNKKVNNNEEKECDRIHCWAQVADGTPKRLA